MRAILRSFQYAFLEWLALFPFLLWMNSLLLDNYFQGLTWFYFPIVYLVAALLGRLIIKDYLKIIIGLMIGFGFALVISIDGIWPQTFILILFSATAIRGFQYGQTKVHGIFPIGLIWGLSLPAYFISYLVYRNTSGADQLQLLTILALVLLFFLLFLTNREHLSQASLVKTNVRKMSKKLKYQNYLYIFIFFIFILLLTEFNPIASGLVFILRWIFQLLGRTTPDTTMQPEPEMDNPGLGGLGAAETSRWAEIMNLIFQIIGYTALVFIVIFILYQLLKRIPFFAKKIKTFVEYIKDLLLKLRKGRSFDHDLGYEDETESVFDLGQSMDRFVDNVKSRFTRSVTWSRLTDKEKARELYRLVIKHARKEGFTYKTSETAQENINRIEEQLTADQNLTKKFAHIYDQARYSSLSIEQIDELKEEFKQIGWIS